MIKFHVIDNGKGIQKKDMKKLFRMFGKLRRTAEINNEGIGLGLMICSKLVKMNKGSISVHSDGEGKGSIFTFSMRMLLPSRHKKKSKEKRGFSKIYSSEAGNSFNNSDLALSVTSGIDSLIPRSDADQSNES